MNFADRGGLLALIIFLLVLGESGHHLFFGILPDFKHWCLSLLILCVLCQWLGVAGTDSFVGISLHHLLIC